MSEASDPTFKTINFQYYILVVLIQIKYFCNSEAGRRWRFQGVETPPKPIHISKKQLCKMKAGIAKSAQSHLL